MQITQETKDRLLDRGVSTLHQGEFGLPDESFFEPPCSIKWMAINHSIKLGAFSYAVSGYYFAVSIGRYTSIGEQVQVGRGSHPVSWGSTSPLFYQRHQDVFNFDLRAAHSFQPNAPYVAPLTTVIGNDVYIGHGAFLMQGVTIGDGAVIGACSVVTKDVPAYSIVAGSPAVVRKMRFTDRVIERMHAVKWWQYAFWDLGGIPVSDPFAFLDFVEQRQDEGVLPYTPDLVILKTFAN